MLDYLFTVLIGERCKGLSLKSWQAGCMAIIDATRKNIMVQKIVRNMCAPTSSLFVDYLALSGAFASLNMADRSKKFNNARFNCFS